MGPKEKQKRVLPLAPVLAKTFANRDALKGALAQMLYPLLLSWPPNSNTNGNVTKGAANRNSTKEAFAQMVSPLLFSFLPTGNANSNVTKGAAATPCLGQGEERRHDDEGPVLLDGKALALGPSIGQGR